MSKEKGYYSLEGVVDYKKFLNHFQNQAHGRDKPVLIHTSQNFGKKPKKSLIVVDLADSSKINDGKSDKPKIEVVEPTEAERLRALGEIKRETKKANGGAPKFLKASASRKNTQSVHRNGKGKTRKAGKAYTAIKRAKDVFD